MWEVALLVGSVLGLVVGAGLHVAGAPTAGDATWAVLGAVGVVAATWWVVEAAREGRLGADVVAVLALVGALVVGEPLAAAVITVMLASGRALEARASARAERELRALLARAPRLAHRYDGVDPTDVEVDTVALGDLLAVLPGEVVPVDGLVVSGRAVLDEAALTGEPLPVERTEGDLVRSGVVNAGGPFDLRAAAAASDSTYAGIVRLVAAAQASSSPFVRMADRFAAWFLAGSVALAGLAWAMSGDPVRAVAVLVVATPCPLILAVPVAMVSGLARAARRGVVIKGGAVLERLAGCTALLFDKTGTLTEGRPTVIEVVTDGSITGAELLRLAASLDQVSAHVLASAVVRAARARDLELTSPKGADEVPGEGVQGQVGDRRVAVGKGDWLLPAPPRAGLGRFVVVPTWTGP